MYLINLVILGLLDIQVVKELLLISLKQIFQILKYTLRPDIN